MTDKPSRNYVLEAKNRSVTFIDELHLVAKMGQTHVFVVKN